MRFAMPVTYTDPDREAAFSIYVTPKPRLASLIMHCLVFLSIFQSYGVLGHNPDFNTAVDGALLLFNALAAITTVFGIAVFISSCRADQANVGKRALLCWLHDCNWAILCAAGFVHTRAQAVSAVSNGCKYDVFFYEQTSSRAFRDFNCWRRFQFNTGIGIFVICVILNVKFRQCAIAATVGTVVIMPICLAIWPHRHIELTIADFIYTLALTAFIAFARYEVEKDQRRAFEVHEAHGRHLEELETLSADIEALVQRLLPRGIVARSSSAKLRAKLKDRDVSHEAIALVMKVADFEGVSTQRLQGRVALAVESVMAALMKLLPDCGLDRVSVLLDEFVAVGNLLEPINQRKSVIGACSAAKRLAAVKNEDSLPLVFGIDVGTAVGEFVGSADFMRYDVRGPVVTTARSLTMVAKAGQVLLSNAASDLVSDAVVVRDGPAFCDTSMNLTDSSISSDQAYVPSDHASQNDSTSVILTELRDSAVQRIAQEEILAGSSSFGDSVVNSSKTSLGDDGTHFIAKVARFRKDIQDFEPLESELARDCCLYRRFHNPEVEEQYTVWRMHANVNRGQRTWLVYAWVVLAFAVVLFLDMNEMRGPYGLILLMIASFASYAASWLPSRLRHLDIARWFNSWGFLTLMIPLVVVTGMGISRPSAIGSDVRVMLFAGTIVRVTCFAHARHELFATPILLLLSHLQFLAPGGVLQLPTILQYIGVMVFVLGNAALDHAQRLAFAASQRLETATAFVEREQELRLGLLQSSMPAPIFDALQNKRLAMGVLMVPDSHVITVSRVAPRAKQQQATEIPRAEDFDNALCEALHGLSYFHICSVSGDRALVLAGVCTSVDDANQFGDMVRSSGEHVLKEMFAFCARITATGQFRCIGDIDTTLQAINPANSTVTFSVYGVAVTRTLAIDAAAGEAVGVLVTSHVTAFLSGTSDLQLDITTQPLPTWRVRGVGQFQLTKISLAITS